MRTTFLLLAVLVLVFAGCKNQANPFGFLNSCPQGGKCDEGRSPGEGSSEAGQIITEAGPLWDADVTMLIYAANDDRSKKLVDSFHEDALEWQHGLGGSSMFRILVERDYAKEADGTAPPSERYGLYRETPFNPETHKLGSTMTLGETDSSDPERLKEFLVYGIRKFPARVYWVIITGHGDSWNGAAFDATTGSDKRMSLLGMQQAFQAASDVIRNEIRPRLKGNFPSNKIDVVQFDTCRLGAIEAAAAFSDSVDYVIGSQEKMPNAGHPYSSLRMLAQNHTAKAPWNIVKEVVTAYVLAYVEGVSTVNRGYVGTTVSSVGLDLNQLVPLLTALGKLKDEVIEEREAGFTCQEVKAIGEEAAGRAGLEDYQGGRSPLRDAESATQAEEILAQDGGRATEAAKASIDLVSLLYVLSNPETVHVSDKVKQAAAHALDVIGRPNDSSTGFGGRYRKIVSFNPRNNSAEKSPFVVEAHTITENGEQASGLSILWGDPYELLFKKNGLTPLDTYRDQPFHEKTGWLEIMRHCIQKTKDCLEWSPDPSNPEAQNPCKEL
ncbi:MAG: clostripain-related cysteine peptidase [Pseudomonadota bacterium]